MRFRDRRLFVERVTAVYTGGSTSTGEWTPAVDVYETRDSFYLVAEVAGVKQEDIKVEVAENVITLRGTRPFSRKGVSSEDYYRIEFSYGSFERSFTLPCAVEEKEVKAVLKRGVLTVRLPRCGARHGSKVEVNGE